MTIGSTLVEDSQSSSLLKKVIDAAVLGLLAWLCWSVQQMQIDIAVIQTQTAQFGEPTERWTQDEHLVYAKAVDKEIEDIEKRLRALEQK